MEFNATMKSSQFLPHLTLVKLLTLYSNVDDEAKIPGHSSPFIEFLEFSGGETTLASGEILFEQDNPGDKMYWIESGALAVLQGDLERPTVLTFRHPGQVVGEIALLENIPRTATVAAVVPTRVRCMSNDKFQKLLESIPVVGVELMRLLSARLREVQPAELNAGFYDHLTGALSRQAFDTRLYEEIERAHRYKYVFSLVFIDLDNFKEINDTHGHPRGDEVLIAFVQRIMDDLRTTDMFFRYGGDEFVLILPGIDDVRGPALINRLLENLDSTPFDGVPPVRLLFSAGIAYYPLDGDSPEALLKTADQRLYLSKWSGRGKVTGPASSGSN